ncbi:MAG TPA: hypothetical protein VNE38_15920 [Ktedonobacteraceae bacterium]|nr:hypothetical protein [Ktedonobacteraceae bacterium]
MNDDHSERRIYRKSPGRQYGYDYDPLRSQPLNGTTQSGRLSGTSPRSEPLSGKDTGSISGRQTTGPLVPRPDPRRARQLLRQQIIATKSKTGTSEDTGQIDPDIHADLQDMELEDEVQTLRKRTPARVEGSRFLHPARPYNDYEVYPVQARHPSRIVEDPLEQRVPFDDELDLLDPDILYDHEADPLEGRVGRPDPARVPAVRRDYLPEVTDRGRRRGFAPQDDIDDEEEVEQREKPKKKKRGLFSRRKLIVGALVVGGGAVAAYEFGPKIPQALESAGSNVEHQIQDAFNRGVAAGGEAVRKELINGLDTLEGVSLEGAIGAAHLTRVAYDVFVSPIVTLASTIADDFLLALLNALIKARSWLAQINADNATLLALTNILKNWSDQAHNMPKKLQTITETDLDGAQAYLLALQRKIQAEQAILNGQATPTPNASAIPKASTTPGASSTP